MEDAAKNVASASEKMLHGLDAAYEHSTLSLDYMISMDNGWKSQENFVLNRRAETGRQVIRVIMSITDNDGSAILIFYHSWR
jgi:hypothetical protein